MIRPGEIYRADHRTATPHPVIVVSREALNRGRYVLAVMITSARFPVRSTLPHCVPIRAGEFGLTKEGVAQAETIAPYELTDLDLTAPIGKLDDGRLRDLIKAVGYVMESDCEPE
jgi:mRNA-degrading endonuclease toxin of MazEF toxin-antitoxin module